jgi:hypothetical protein
LVSCFLTGCAALKKGNRTLPVVAGKGRNEISVKDVLNNNLTRENFFIQKAEIEVKSDEINEKFLASIKFAVPDTYNISLRTRTGIEVARIFLTKDTILANDRLNRVVYYGKPDLLGRRYGINSDAIPVLFGDYINTSVDTIAKCSENQSDISGSIHGLRIHYVINCKVNKIEKSVQEGSIGKAANEIEYDDFTEIGNIVAPMLIEIKQINSKTGITIRMGKIERPWAGSVKFVPGSRYDLIELK